MAIHVDRITVTAPTLNAITLGAGGSLTVGITYYYRVIALRSYEGRYALSEASAAQSVTPTSGNQTAQLSWAAVADADAYIIQRTTTPGSYPVEGQNTLNLNGQSYSGYPYATTQTSLNDDGGAVSNIRFNSPNLDFDTEHALIEVYGDAITDVATLWDVASALAGGGFSDLQLLGTAGLQGGTYWQAEGVYLLRGTLYVRDCTYTQYGTLISVSGCLTFKDNSAIVEIGSLSTRYLPCSLLLGLSRIPFTNDNNSYAGTYSHGRQIQGKYGQSSFINYFIEQPLNYHVVGGYPGVQYDKDATPPDWKYIDVTNSILNMGGSNIAPIYPETGTKKNIYGEVRLQQGKLYDSVIRGGHYTTLYYANNLAFEKIHVRDMTQQDLRIFSSVGQRGSALIDCLFEGMGQSDNQPYMTGTKTGTEIATAIFLVTRNFLVLDNTGPVEGAIITALNADGLSAFWEDSLATFASALDAATDPASLTVSDGSKFNENDHIRGETYGEVLKVTGIAGNVLTVARAQFGTTIRKHVTGNNNRVLKMVEALTTDANGEAGGDEATLQRELYSLSGSGSQTNYEDTLIDTGYLGRNFYGPYQLKISKAGDADYLEDKFLDPEVEKYPLGPGTLEIGLSAVPPPVYVSVPSGEMDIILEDLPPLEAVLEAVGITVELSDG
jgi:hypothetical protein